MKCTALGVAVLLCVGLLPLNCLHGQDTAGTIVTRKMSRYDAEGILQWFETVEVDRDGRISRLCRYYADGDLLRYTTHQYDADGRLIRSATHDRRGTITKSSAYEYDSDGRKSKVTAYDIVTGSGVSTYEYSSQGRVTRTIRYDDAGEMRGYDDREYDLDGNLVRQTHYDANDDITRQLEWDFTPDGRLIEVRFYKDGALRYRSLTEYEHGRAARTSQYGNDGNPLGYSIPYYGSDGPVWKQEEYDAIGNLRFYTEHQYGDY